MVFCFVENCPLRGTRSNMGSPIMGIFMNTKKSLCYGVKRHKIHDLCVFLMRFPKGLMCFCV